MATEKKAKKATCKKAPSPSELDVYNRHLELFMEHRRLIAQREALSQKDQIEFDAVCAKRGCLVPGNPPS